MPVQTVESYEDVLTFGKHKGKTVDWITDNDLSYIIWLIDNDVVRFPIEILDASYQDYLNRFPLEEWFIERD